tara:strand:+ start:840 stop:1022 length:183 start_codon:yes stop_codon:yes gene_type:complete
MLFFGVQLQIYSESFLEQRRVIEKLVQFLINKLLLDYRLVDFHLQTTVEYSFGVLFLRRI